MTPTIHKSGFWEQTGRYSKFGWRQHRFIRLYIIRVNGRRIDSFLRYRNAQRRVRELKTNQ